MRRSCWEGFDIMAQATWKTALIQKLNAVTGIRSRVGGRIYGAYLADITDPQYPCINFFSEGGSRSLSYLSYARMSIRFWVYSDNNFEEAHTIFDLIKAEMNNSILSSDEVTMSFQLMVEPDEIHDGRLRGVTAPFVVRKL